MSRLVLYMSMSLDGFITGPDDGPGCALRREGEWLSNWPDDRMSDGPSGQVFRELCPPAQTTRSTDGVRAAVVR